MPTDNKNSAFSLIELMIAVSVLSIGIILIARSFISAAGAIDTGENKIMAVNFLDGKMADVEERILSGDKTILEPDSQNAMINARTAQFTRGSSEVVLGKKEDAVNKITLSISWREGSRVQDEILSAYFEKKKEQPDAG